MCRFLLAKSKTELQAQPLLEKFAGMAERSKAFDGDWQGDGWGVSWLDEAREWQVIRSLNPIWRDSEIFPRVPSTRQLLIHARSASFPEHKGVLEYNQPFIVGKYAFVFNGLLKGVALPFSLPGIIGAQKIWSLLQKNLRDHSPEVALQQTAEMLQKHTRQIQALNMGFSDGNNLYSYCSFGAHPDYYQLRLHSASDLQIICSEELPGYDFQPVPVGEVVTQ